MRSNLSPLRTTAAIGAAIALTLAACGGDDDGGDDGGGAAASAPAATDAAVSTDPPAATDAPAPPSIAADTQGDSATITIADFSFGGVTEISVGTRVVVTNTDGAPHTWSADDGVFDSGSLGEGDTFEFTFTEPGEFPYHCNFHPSMTGTITVTG